MSSAETVIAAVPQRSIDEPVLLDLFINYRTVFLYTTI